MRLSADELVDAFKDMPLGDLVGFRRKFEETFGVSADAPAPAPPAPVETTEEPEEQTEFDVILEAAGERKVVVIKTVRQLVPGLELKAAKDLVDAAPKTILEQIPKQRAEEAREKLGAAGATVTVR